ncbi:GAF domain protein [Synechococcus sp. PCC 7335]|uniref:GAF domain-containing protein n=1 Tax=Synechococcus sp. (strain ATCC 29403 / PCC 7335) TaxID=91464 RepID=UPI00017EB8A7|nr:GAF domain-containing protein [Synechococcus sp. PCC 7335]EDX85827.1 GAF domain protein [Synechococcus sp. PCC 7335]
MVSTVQQNQQHNSHQGTRQTFASRQRQLLSGVAEATRKLLAVADFDAAVNGALEAIATSANIDRIYILENKVDSASQEVVAECPYEWTAEGVVRGSDSPGRFPMTYTVFGDWLDRWQQGESIQALARELSNIAQALQEKDEALSLLTVPIEVENQLWGVIGFDDCTTERVWGETEIAVLETAAASFAGALQRQENERALAERDHILEATAAASAVLLNGEDFNTAVIAAFQILGESIGFDRIAVGQQIDDPTGKTSGFVRFLYEWNRQGISAQLSDHEDMTDFWWDEIGIHHWYEANLRGEAFGELIDNLPEPFRSLMAPVDVKSTHNIPIFVEGQFWGVFGIDHCRKKKLLSQNALDALKTAANCVGSAIAQDRLRQDRAAVVEAHNKALAERDRILEATAAAANVMLTESDFDLAVNRALKIVGEGLDVDRVGLMKYFWPTEEQTYGYHHEMYEQVTLGLPAQIKHPELEKISDKGIEFVVENLKKGEIFGGIVDELAEPFRSGQKELHVQSTYCIPVMIKGCYWGSLALDDCHKETHRSEAELGALMTLANCIGSAIEQDINRKAREAAERMALIERERAARAAELEAANAVLTTRDRWLETTAAAANELLSSSDIEASVQAALQTIGENLECDRLSVLRYIPDPNEHPLGALQGIYEWDAVGIRPQIKDLNLSTISAEGFEDWFEQLLKGEWVGSSVSELSEPARSGQVALGVLSTYAVPIFIEGQLWGTVAMDYCHEEKQLSAAEISVFKTAASCVGSAIYQAQVRRDKAAQERSRLLGSVAEAANLLLRSADFTEVLPEVTRLLGEAVGSDRCGITQDILLESSDELGTRLLEEWCREGVIPAVKVAPDAFPEKDTFLIKGDFLRFHQALRRGEIVNFHVNDLSDDEKAFLEAQGNTSMLIVPIMVQDKIWGSIGFDNCGEPRLYDEAEIAILKVAAESIAAAVARQAQDEALRESEKAVLAEREKAAKKRAAQLAKTNEAIAQTLTTLAASPELDQFLGTILAEMSRQLNAAKVHLFLYDQPTHTLTQRVVVQAGEMYLGVGPDDPEMFRRPIPADITPAWERIINGDKPLTYDETQPIDEEIWWPETVAWHQAQGHKAITCIPLRAGDVPIGFIGYAFYDRTFLSDEQLEFMQALANQAIVAIQLTRLSEEAKQAAILQEREKAAKKRAAQLTRSNQALKRSLDSLAQQPELEAFLQRVVDEAAAQTGAKSGHLFLVDEKANCWFLQVSTDNGGDWRSVADMELWQRPLPLDAAPEFSAKILQKQPIVIENLRETLRPGPHIWEPSIAWHLQRNHTSIICVPLVLGDRVLGFLGLPFVGATHITQDDIELAQALANQATLAIQLTRLAEEAKQTAILQEQERAARQHVTELAKTNDALSETLTALTATPELNDFLGQNLSKMAEQVGANAAHLFLYDAAAHTLRQHITVQDGKVYQGNAPTDPDIFRHPIPANLTRAWEIVVNSSKPFTLDENHPDAIEFFWPESILWHQAQGHTSAVCACMKVGDQPLGFIGFAFTDRTLLTEEQLQFIQALTNQATLSLHLTRLAEAAQTNALSSALTSERNRLAREIHDTLAQAFTGVSLQLEAAKAAAPDNLEDSTYHIDRAGQLARRGLSEARRSVHALRSQALETDTLPNALRTALYEMTQSSPTQPHFRLKGTPFALPENIQTNLLRIGQEAITNALRHAQADNLTLLLEFSPAQVRLSVTDDGTGCEISSFSELEGFGLMGMRERVYRFDGHFSFTSHPRRGTVIDITIPTCP